MLGKVLVRSPHQEITVSQEKMCAEQNKQDLTLQFTARGPWPDIILYATVTAERGCALWEKASGCSRFKSQCYILICLALEKSSLL